MGQPSTRTILEMSDQDIYRTLSGFAKLVMRGQRRTPTFETEELLQQYVTKFIRAFDDSAPDEDRRALIRCAGKRMRQVLLDAVRTRNALKRNEGVRPGPLDESRIVLVDGDDRQTRTPVDIEAIDAAIQQLEDEDELAATVINGLFFGQMSRCDLAQRLDLDIDDVENARARGKRSLQRLLLEADEPIE